VIFLTPAIGSTRRCVIEEHLVFGLGRDIAQEVLVLAWKVLKDEQDAHRVSPQLRVSPISVTQRTCAEAARAISAGVVAHPRGRAAT
jgi:hypothetical protein